MAATERRAERARAPQPSADLEQARAERAGVVRAQEALERRSMLRGLLLVAVIVLAASFWRAGLDRVFVPGWWQQW